MERASQKHDFLKILEFHIHVLFKHLAKCIYFQTVLNLSRMSCEEEVISVRKQLEKMSKEGDDQTQALDLLKSLGKLPINLQVLTNTRCISLLINCSWKFLFGI